MTQLREQRFLFTVGAALAPLAFVAPSYAVQYLSIAEAKQLCFPSATRFEELTITLTQAQQDQIELQSDVAPPSAEVKAWRVFGESGELGVLFLDHVIGKHLLIDYVLAVAPDGAVRQIEILEYRENYGGEIRDSAWRKNFVGKTSESQLVLRKDIPNISGATYSTLHVTEGVRRLLATYDVLFRK